MNAVEIVVLRSLIVHNWRRLVLRHPALPAAFVDQDWPGHQCHVLVADLLARFPRPKLQEVLLHQAA